MPLNLDNPRSAPRQIADHLAERIRAGEFAPGHALPNTAALAGEWEVSRMTIRNAINLLRAEGLVIGVKGRGIYVIDALPHTFNLADPPGIGTAQAPAVAVPPIREAAAALGISIEDPVPTQMHREVDERGRTVARTTSTVRRPLPTAGATLDQAPPFTPGETADLLYARVPTSDEVYEMGLQAGVPVLVRERTEYDVAGDATAHHLTVYNGPLVRLEHRTA